MQSAKSLVIMSTCFFMWTACGGESQELGEDLLGKAELQEVDICQGEPQGKELLGYIKDEQGHPLINAELEILTSCKQLVQTDDEGAFFLRAFPPADHLIVGTLKLRTRSALSTRFFIFQEASIHYFKIVSEDSALELVVDDGLN